MQTSFWVFVIFLSCGWAHAQDYVDLFSADYTITPANVFDSSNIATRMQEINGDLTVPIRLNDSATILTGVTYENTLASFDLNRPRESITGLTLKMGAHLKHGDRLSATYMLLPKFSSDFEHISSRDFQLGAAVLLKYEQSKNFNYKFGGYYNGELFGPFFVPIFGFYYLSPDEKFETKALLPLSVALNYNFIDNLSVGLTYRGQIRSYDFEIPAGTEENRYITRSTNEVYMYLQYGFKSGLHFQIHAGRSVGRSYRIYHEKVPFAMPLLYFGDNRTQLNTDFADGWLCKVAALYRLQL